MNVARPLFGVMISSGDPTPTQSSLQLFQLRPTLLVSTKMELTSLTSPKYYWDQTARHCICYLTLVLLRPGLWGLVVRQLHASPTTLLALETRLPFSQQLLHSVLPMDQVL